MKRLYALLVVLLFCGCDAPVVPEKQVPIVKPPAINIEAPGVEIEIPVVKPFTEVESKEITCIDYLRSTCRIRGGGSGGSGACFKIDDKYVYVLTCRHVVGKTKTFTIEFWLDGRITGKYTGKIFKILTVDAAVIIIPVDDFKEGELPIAIPISPVGPNDHAPIISIGCPGLSWQSLWEGHVIKMNEKPKQSFLFVPPPKGGRSGSAIFQDGLIVGVLWGTDNNSKGYAVNSADLGNLITTGNLMFSADWCKHCQQMKPVVEALDGIDVQVIDYDLNTAFAELYGINSLPAYVNEDGETISGVKSAEELREFYRGVE